MRNEPSRFQSPAYLAVLDSSASPFQLHITPVAIASMKAAAMECYPLESCGLLIGYISDGHWHVHEARQVANINGERASDRFQLDPAAYQHIDRELRGSGHEIIGVFHSHPDCPAKPSPTDIAHAWEGFVYPIVSIVEGSVQNIRVWTPNAAATMFQEVCIHPAA